jgi:hypothetical protein
MVQLRQLVKQTKTTKTKTVLFEAVPMEQGSVSFLLFSLQLQRWASSSEGSGVVDPAKICQGLLGWYAVPQR